MEYRCGPFDGPYETNYTIEQIMGSKPPRPDPCLVEFYIGEGRKPKEKDWIEARNCEFGCGEVCKRAQKAREQDKLEAP